MGKPDQEESAEKKPATAGDTKAGADRAGAKQPAANQGSEKEPRKVSKPPRIVEIAQLRKFLAQTLWALFVLAALFLAVGALLIALEANQDNSLVKFVLDGADAVDLNVFSRENGIKEFTSGSADSVATKNALFNWGLGAVAWLVVGRIVDRLVRP